MKLARAVAVLAAAWGAACFTKPAFDGDDGGVDPDGRDTDSMIDIDSAPPTCMSMFSDDFSVSGGNPCGAWGMLTLSTTVAVARQNGELVMTFPASGGGSGGCTSTAFNFANGASIQLQPLTTAMYTEHGLTITDSFQNASTRIAAINDMGTMRIEMTTHNFQTMTMPYGQSGGKWLRLLPITNKTVQASFSSDGTSWTTLGTDTYPSGITTVRAGINISGGIANGTARWDNFNIKTCPP